MIDVHAIILFIAVGSRLSSYAALPHSGQIAQSGQEKSVCFAYTRPVTVFAEKWPRHFAPKALI